MGAILTSVLVVLAATAVVATIVSHRRLAQKITPLESATSSLRHSHDLLTDQVGQLDQEAWEELRGMGIRFDAALGHTHGSLQKNDQKFRTVAGLLSAQHDAITSLDRRLRALQGELNQVTQAVSAAAARQGRHEQRAGRQLRQVAEQSASLAREIGSLRDYVHHQLRDSTDGPRPSGAPNDPGSPE